MLPTLQLEEESLPILTVAEECSKEFPDTSRFIWLISMARAIYSEPPQLLLRPDETWDRKKQTQRPRIISPGLGGYDIYSTNNEPLLGDSIKKKHRRKATQSSAAQPTTIKYSKELSPLKQLTTPIKSFTEPHGIGPRTFPEKIHRDDFRAWCLTSGYNLPRFWFGSETVTITSSSAPTTTAETPPRRTQEDIVSDGRNAGKQPWEIAYDLDTEFKGSYRLTPEQLGRLLPANPGTTIAPDSDKKRGQRLRQKYLILNNHPRG